MHIRDVPSCKVYKCLFIYICLIISVVSDGLFIRDLCVFRDDYNVIDNCAIMKNERIFLINHLCIS